MGHGIDTWRAYQRPDGCSAGSWKSNMPNSLASSHTNDRHCGHATQYASSREQPNRVPELSDLEYIRDIEPLSILSIYGRGIVSLARRACGCDVEMVPSPRVPFASLELHQIVAFSTGGVRLRIEYGRAVDALDSHLGTTNWPVCGIPDSPPYPLRKGSGSCARARKDHHRGHQKSDCAERYSCNG